MSNFAMDTILGKGFAQAQVPKARVLWTVCTSAFAKLFPKISPHGEIAFSNITCINNVIMHYSVLLCKAKYIDKQIVKLHAYYGGMIPYDLIPP